MDATRRRLRAVAGLGGVTDEALRRNCTTIRGQPNLVDGVLLRHAASRATMAAMGDIGQTDELPTKDIPSIWHRVEPQALLRWSLEGVPGLASVFEERFRPCPCAFGPPWPLCFYCTSFFSQVRNGRAIKRKIGSKLELN